MYNTKQKMIWALWFTTMMACTAQEASTMKNHATCPIEKQFQQIETSLNSIQNYLNALAKNIDPKKNSPTVLAYKQDLEKYKKEIDLLKTIHPSDPKVEKKYKDIATKIQNIKDQLYKYIKVSRTPPQTHKTDQLYKSKTLQTTLYSPSSRTVLVLSSKNVPIPTCENNSKSATLWNTLKKPINCSKTCVAPIPKEVIHITQSNMHNATTPINCSETCVPRVPTECANRQITQSNMHNAKKPTIQPKISLCKRLLKFLPTKIMVLGSLLATIAYYSHGNQKKSQVTKTRTAPHQADKKSGQNTKIAWLFFVFAFMGIGLLFLLQKRKKKEQ